MSFIDTVTRDTCASRSTRAEFWWFALFVWIVQAVLYIRLIILLITPSTPGQNRFGWDQVMAPSHSVRRRRS